MSKGRRMLVVMVAALVAAAAVFALPMGWLDSRVHKIEIERGEGLVVTCPKRAREGETVRMETLVVMDADLEVAVPGTDGHYVSEGFYEFTMPDHDVSVRLWVDDSSYPGA